ncbi:toll/interleukin-1 receptor domain-containing protein [Mycobacterium sp.]|uniref:toll/interleukin-1 receptor domain-containing protein n=1 Tax=Mycobacterium sp. TaxID=1785 RepID=UPI002B7E3643|nr:toll/interleukin-1 receptor domain-containing protein [Mycobacterium sp.]HTQ20079.1 toll/interleukin-1 receptor domain-containing protein [Mycobacterium sp.]
MAKVFVSYSRQDEVAVTALVADLDRGNLDVWFDKELRGGDAWWTEILEQIRKCEVFLFALSDSALRSKPCRSELGYARELNLPILPVQIGEVSSYRIDPIFSVQGIDYRDASAATGFALMGSIYQHAARRAELPEPLPAPPRIPYEYLQRLGVTIHSSEELAPSVRRQLVFELRAALEEEHELSVRTDIIGLLQTMLSRADVTRARNPPTPTPPPSQHRALRKPSYARCMWKPVRS